MNLRALAVQASVPVFIAANATDRDRVDDLSLDPSIQIATSPRHAHVLMVVGTLCDQDLDSLGRVHDQLPHPRATLFWGAQVVPGLEQCVRVDAGRDPGSTLNALFRQLMRGKRSSEPDLCPDEPPAPWQGRGEYGQGGKGMMGGVPWGRPMAMTDEDLRDGLTLDAYTMQIGPFLPMLPAGLVLSVTLQGDVIQKARVLRLPASPPDLEYELADDAPKPAVVALERRRAARNLRCLARALKILELPALAERARRAATRTEEDTICNLRSLRWLLALSGAMPAIPKGLGVVGRAHAPLLHGSAARASGQAHDWRAGHPAYQQLGFRCVNQQPGDVRARLRQWLIEASQSLELLAGHREQHLGSPRATGSGVGVPSPSIRRAAPAAVMTETDTHVLEDLLPGLEWQEAMLVINSFDADDLARMIVQHHDHDPRPTGKAA